MQVEHQFIQQPASNVLTTLSSSLAHPTSCTQVSPGASDVYGLVLYSAGLLDTHTLKVIVLGRECRYIIMCKYLYLTMIYLNCSQ